MEGSAVFVLLLQFPNFDNVKELYSSVILLQADQGQNGQQKAKSKSWIRITELGTGQHCCDNVTMFSGQTIVVVLLHYGYSIFVEASPFRHQNVNIFRILFVTEPLTFCRFVALWLSRAQHRVATISMEKRTFFCLTLL